MEGKLQVLLGHLVNVRGLQLESSRVLHETMLMPVLMYGSENDMKRGEVHD